MMNQANTHRLLVDVRNQDEIDSVKYNIHEPSNRYKDILYMPSNIIQYNRDLLLDFFKQYDSIDIICKSGTRSKKIKEKYFKENEKVQIAPFHFNTLGGDFVIKSTGLHLSVTRKIQIISGSIILFLFVLLFFHDKVKYLFLAFGCLMLYVGISGNCFMSPLLSKNDI